MRNLYSDMMKSISYEKLLPDIYSLYIYLIVLWSILFCIIKIYFDDDFILLFIHYYIVGRFIIFILVYKIFEDEFSCIVYIFGGLMKRYFITFL